MSYQTLRFETDGGVAIITLARPERVNALSVTLLQELIHAVDHVRDSGAYRALLIAAEGRGFCSGADLTSPPPEQLPHLPALNADYGHRIEQFYNPLIVRLFNLDVPVVSAVNGVAAGAGCSLALAADFVVASDSAYFVQSFANIGLVPDAGATWMIARAVGRARAMEMMILGEKLSAQTALDWGLIHRVTALENLAETAKALAARLARGPTAAYAIIRKGIRCALEGSLIESMALERDNQRIAGATDDFVEGRQAFLEKRSARFTGR